MFSYESLDIWKLSVNYAKNIYQVTTNFPKHEQYALANQLNRAAISISANIAEGSGSVGLKDRLNYLDIAVKSALETTSEIEIAFQLKYVHKSTRDNLYEQAEKIIRKVHSYKKFLQTDNR